MTCICWDGTLLAADTLYTVGSRKMQGHYEKILFPEGKQWTVEGKKVLVIGCAGGVAHIQKIKSLLEEGVTVATDPVPADNNFHLLIVTENKEVYNWSVGLDSTGGVVNDLYITNGNFAIGCGGIYGLGVMAIKGNAIDGVRAAMKIDLYTGGYIDVWSFDKPETLHRIDPNPLTEEQAKLEEEQGGAILCAPGG